ncbi:isoprenoid synthase domain-containing protein [Umbelopsis sp. PMI_123]|nr:isoprenoid synthase domain-containing protein [Umbelopsis sp. PMI_123]
MAQTINCANYVYFLAMQELQKLSNFKLLTIFSEEILNLHRGQGIELFWRDSITCPTEDEFINMINNKTGGLLRLAVRLMMAASNVEMDYTRLVNLVGIHFQIRDDYMNLQSKHYTDSKGFCEDLSEGKFSFPVIHSIRVNPHDRQLLEILKQKPQSVELKQYALKLMEATNTFDYTKKYLRNVYTDIQQEVYKFGNNPLLDEILLQLDVQD